MDNATDQTGAPAQRLAEAGRAAFDEVKGKAKSALQDGSQKLASSGSAGAQEIRNLADRMGEDQAWLRSALRSSADGLDAATRSLQGGDFRSLANTITNFARREPVIFVGACLIGGYALARIGKTALESEGYSNTSSDAATFYAAGDLRSGSNGEGV